MSLEDQIIEGLVIAGYDPAVARACLANYTREKELSTATKAYMKGFRDGQDKNIASTIRALIKGEDD